MPTEARLPEGRLTEENYTEIEDALDYLFTRYREVAHVSREERGPQEKFQELYQAFNHERPVKPRELMAYSNDFHSPVHFFSELNELEDLLEDRDPGPANPSKADHGTNHVRLGEDHYTGPLVTPEDQEQPADDLPENRKPGISFT